MLQMPLGWVDIPKSILKALKDPLSPHKVPQEFYNFQTYALAVEVF